MHIETLTYKNDQIKPILCFSKKPKYKENNYQLHKMNLMTGAVKRVKRTKNSLMYTIVRKIIILKLEK